VSTDDTYWVDGNQVSKAEYVAAERAAGFRNTLGQPDEPATSWWHGVGADGFHHSGHMGWLRGSPLDLSGLGIPQTTSVVNAVEPLPAGKSTPSPKPKPVRRRWWRRRRR